MTVEVRCEPGQVGSPAVADQEIILIPADSDAMSFLKDREGFRWRGKATLVCNLDPSHRVELIPTSWMPTAILARIPPVGPCDEATVVDDLHQPENERWRFHLELKVPQGQPDGAERDLESASLDVQGYEGTGYRPFNWPPQRRSPE